MSTDSKALPFTLSLLSWLDQPVSSSLDSLSVLPHFFCLSLHLRV
jgi:hypothetical protein